MSGSEGNHRFHVGTGENLNTQAGKERAKCKAQVRAKAGGCGSGLSQLHPSSLSNQLAFRPALEDARRMEMPKERVSLDPADVERLNSRLSDMRHNVNNSLSLVIAAAELMKHKPDTAARMLEAISQQPAKVIAEIRAFSDEFEKMFGITRD